MKKRECLYEISDLNLDGVMVRMTDGQLKEYWDKLYAFIEKYPELEDNLKTYLSAKDYKDFFTGLATLQTMLEEIHADAMVQEIKAQSRINSKYENIKHDRLEAFMTYFLSTVSMLSIDIQKADYESNEAAADESASEAAAEVAEPDMSNQQKTILAVDDQAIHLNALKAHLGDSPYKLTCLTSGSDALRFIGKNAPDLFILDIMMPVMDGFELAHKIKESGQKGKIIFLSGSSSQDNVTKAIKAGCVDFISKPAVKEIVINKISKHI